MATMTLAKRTSGLGAPSASPHWEGEIPREILDAVEEALRGGDTHYTARPGLLELRAALAQRIAGCGGPALDPATDVVITAGEEEAVFVSIFALGLAGTRCAATTVPPRHSDLFSALSVTITKWNAGGEALYREIHAEVQELSDSVAQIVSAGDLVATQTRWPTTLLTPRTLVVGSLDALPGVATFRVGFVLGRGAVMDKVRSWKQALSICTAGPSQRAVLAALTAASEKGIGR